ncbi:hypothetical protein [Fimbriimonas ginsengisoli]|uniref:hypothetical protein n=1 Tax=Fimbriimonas ginsengisoli TaxID=1005039 RepID=UPI00130EDF15|nr:hypothetical protein [Fimbriimonas ginsengisoli]
MKKIFALTIVAATVFVISGCSKKEEDAAPTVTNTPAPQGSQVGDQKPAQNATNP